MVHRKTFNNARVFKKWQIIIDATELDKEYQNEIIFQNTKVNLINYTETKLQADRKGKRTGATRITSIEITPRRVKKVAKAGRNKWKIEKPPEALTREYKTHMQMNEQVQKKHYLTEQIADFIKQFYEHFYLKKKGIKEVQKNISSKLSANLGRN